MNDLYDLYQEVIIDHSRSPKNFRKIEGAAGSEGFNPLCGDKVILYLQFDGDTLTDVSFQGSGCAISTASASLMTESLKGKSRAEVEETFQQFRDMVTSDPTQPFDASALGKLSALGGVREFPSRVKCATLVWHTLQRALDGDATGPASTE